MSNYEWQKQYSKQKIEIRLREADLHRLAAETPAVKRPGLFASVFRLFSRLVPARRRLPTPDPFHSEKQVKGRGAG